jgi:hypothetical protein
MSFHSSCPQVSAGTKHRPYKKKNIKKPEVVMNPDEDVVREICKVLEKVVTKEVVSTALLHYGNIGTELMAYAVAYDLGSSKMTIV